MDNHLNCIKIIEILAARKAAADIEIRKLENEVRALKGQLSYTEAKEKSPWIII